MLVVGAARSGLAAAAVLRRRGVRVALADERPALDEAPPAGVRLTLGEQDPAPLLRDVEVVVKSPGVPRDRPVVAAALAAGLPVWSEVELAFRLLPPGARLVGITGTNGKTTTTELTGAMLAAGSVPHVVGGNVGTALSAVVDTLAADAVVVCELSSFQLEDVHRLRVDAAALLNVTPDHLDRHGTMEAYAGAKLRIFERQRPADHAVLNVDDPWVAALDALPGSGRRVGTRGADADRVGFAGSRLRGDHNRQNVAVAAALARAIGLGEDPIREAVEGFAPVPHRLEPVGTVAGVALWNDSKATNVDAALKALTAFPDGRVRLILGGSDKGADYGPLARALPGRVRAAYLIGPAGRRMLADLDAAGVPARDAGDLASAVDAALADATAGETILLAPASASFDEFRDYAARGDRFRELARLRGAR